jgi:HAD superfamily hydrolase (TIGR01459 family)
MRRASLRPIKGLSEIADDFEAFLVDQFGVMHDGRRPYDGAAEALTTLKQAGKSVIVLTNSGKRARPNIDRIMSIGFPQSSFSDLVSSGEVAWTGIRESRFGRPFVAGARVGLIGKQGDDYGFDDLGLVLVDDWTEAEALLILGSDCPRTTLDDYKRHLAPAAAKGVPALCCNPDITMLTSQGLQPSSGAIAQVYAALGGRVTFVGKPHAAIYRQASRLAGSDGAAVLAIGDSLDHDILGGAEVGFKTALVRTGILAEMDEAQFGTALDAAPKQPDFILPRLRW